MTTAHPKYRPDIDGLRAVAVLSVLAFHVFPGVARGGFVGVDVFFVISGFLISTILFTNLDRGSFSYADFYRRRVQRIFPSLLVVLMVCLAAGWFVLLPDEYARLGWHTAAGAAFVSNLSLWSESGYFDRAAEVKPLLHLWSLGIEEQFYLGWPLLLALFWRRKRSVAIGVALIAVMSFAGSVALVSTRPAAAFYSPLTRFWELLGGALLAHATLFGRFLRALPERPVLREVSATAGLSLIAASLVLLDRNTPFPGAWAVPPVVGAVAIIAAGPAAWINRRVLGHSAMVKVGLISYPLYLWHWPLLVYLRLIDPQVSVGALRLMKLGAVAVALVAAHLTWRFLEARVRPAKGARTPLILCGAMGLAAVTGLGVVATGGVSRRYSAAQNEIVRVAQESAAAAPSLLREGRCFLCPEQSERDFAPECTASTGRRRILLWGDSHAAHLYPGIAPRIDARTVDFAQLTASACPALLGYTSPDRPHCPSINRYVLDWVRRSRLDTVLLAANWPLYRYADIEATVGELKASGVERVVLIGPVAMFSKPQPRALILATRGSVVPDRIPTPRMEELRTIDATLREIGARSGAEYVSPLSFTCNAAGCLVAPEGQPDRLLAWDETHLTAAGAEFVVSRGLIP